MLIYTPNRQLHVLRILQKTDTTVTYVCTDIAEEEAKNYILNGYLDVKRYQELIPMVMQQKNAYFTDFVEYFTTDGVFYMLFRYQDGIPVRKKADKDDMETRMEYVRRVLEQIILQSMPLEFQYDVLRPERILITGNHEVRFLYMLDEHFGEDEVESHDVERRISEIIEMLLMPELSMRYSLELLDLVRDLKDGGIYKDYQSLYTAYTAIQQDLLSQKGHLVSHKRQFQIWEKVKKHFVTVRRVVAVVIIVAAIAVMGYQTFFKKEKKAEESPLTQIGTLTIRENQPSTTEAATLPEKR